MKTISVNGRGYLLPERPVVVVCVDGNAPEYFEEGLKRGLLPNLARFRSQGFYALADSALPSFTNPNNLSIITGTPPAVHGISGNYFLDPDTGEEVMMNDPRFLRAESLLAALSRNGTRVAVVTAKDKLQSLLGKGLQGICFSAEKAHAATLEENGIADVPQLVGWPTPDVYSATLSEYVMEAGIRLLQRERPEVMYLSTTDYIQHKHAPGDPVADRFYQTLDRYFGVLAEQGAVVAITADHGMNPKNTPDGQPKVIYLASVLDEWLGADADTAKVRVVLPITDPYVAHHGALGSFATVYLGADVDAEAVLAHLRGLEGIVYAGAREEACARFELPPDRVGDLVVVSDARTALGKTPGAHDLSLLEGGLRSHGGLAEQQVPFVLSAPLSPAYQAKARCQRLRNFDIFDYALNGVA